MLRTETKTWDAHAADRHRPGSYRLWSTNIDPVTMTSAIERIRSWIENGEPRCRYVVTPNVDHIVQLDRRPELRIPYSGASLAVADGWPLVTMSRLYGKPLPERVAGSDLLPALCNASEDSPQPLKIFLLGGKPGVAERAASRMARQWPTVQVVGVCSPPFGFEQDLVTNEQICQMVNTSGADILVVGLGFPKQELWLYAHQSKLEVPVALAVGGTIDFLAGEQTRAPKWIQSIKLEWLHRLATNPRRLIGRYSQDAILFPYVCLKHAR